MITSSILFFRKGKFMFAADISNEHGHIEKQVIFDSAALIKLIEYYCLDNDLISPLQYVYKFYEVK